ncbi:MAG: HEPN domain-containing protein [Rhodocyclaceae bacterium]
MDEATLLLTAEWLGKADEDYRAAKLLIEGGLILPALFHCQQAAEKALKGYLCFHHQPVEKTHDITKLIDLAGKIDTVWRKRIEEGALLSPLAIEYRYPGDSEAPDPHLAVTASLAVMEAVRASLPASLFPKTWPTG